jgi:hypothetical protein
METWIVIPEKKLTSTRPISEQKKKICALCDNPATQEALFDIDGSNIILIERYCDVCIKEIQ